MMFLVHFGLVLYVAAERHLCKTVCELIFKNMLQPPYDLHRVALLRLCFDVSQSPLRKYVTFRLRTFSVICCCRLCIFLVFSVFLVYNGNLKKLTIQREHSVAYSPCRVICCKLKQSVNLHYVCWYSFAFSI